MMLESTEAKGDDIEERLINLAVNIVKLCDNLPKTIAGKHIADSCCEVVPHLPHNMLKLEVQKVPEIFSIN